MKLGKIGTAAALLTASSAFAVNYSNEVLAIGVGARGLGMGGAYTAIADDSTAVYWNPAGLSKVNHIELSAIQQGKQYGGLNEVDSRYTFLSGAMNAGDLGAFGGAFMRFGVDGIPQTDGTFNADGSPHELGNFSTQDFGFMASWGKSWHKSFSTGLSLKYLNGGTVGLKTIPDASYSYMGADLGLLVNFGGMSPGMEGLSLGLNVQDLLNTGVKWTNTAKSPTDEVSRNPKIGLAYSPQLQFLKDANSVLSFAVDADPKYEANTLMHYGAEFWYKDTVAFRGGIRQFLGGLQNIEGTLGASFKLFILEVDYAFINYELTPIHYLSLAVKF